MLRLEGKVALVTGALRASERGSPRGWLRPGHRSR
jgi:hypothetical protein